VGILIMTDSAASPATTAMAAPSPYKSFTAEAATDYVTTPEVAEIVNLAIHLSRPLLVEGEAGCGKTRLAYAIAAVLGLGDVVAATVKSTSQAKDLLYRFDALRRLQDAQDLKSDKGRDVYPYIHLQPLGKAIASGKPCLVLIDEIDKADIDFPNDLLDVLDRYEFEIDDLPDEESARCAADAAKGFGRVVKAKPGGAKPIVVITSNREKPLPEPFLRRCLYIQLTFPTDPVLLAKIVQSNLSRSGEQIQESLIHHAVREFLAVRQRSEECDLQKPPSTSELVDWVRALHWQQRDETNVYASELRPTDHAILLKLQRDLETWKRSSDSEAPG
jgi:MoxR-like ATPase